MTSKKIFFPPSVAKAAFITKATPGAEPLIKIGAAAALLGMARVTVRRRVADGSLPYLRIKGRLYFRKSEIQGFVEAHRGNHGG